MLISGCVMSYYTLSIHFTVAHLLTKQTSIIQFLDIRRMSFDEIIKVLCLKKKYKVNFFLSSIINQNLTSMNWTYYLLMINMAYWPCISSRWLDIGQVLFCMFVDQDGVKVHKPAKKEQGQLLAILTEQA